MNNILTASRMGCLIRCPRQHFWNYEVGLRKISTGVALRIGSSWAKALEAMWKGATYEESLAIALPVGIELDETSVSIVAALLAGYYDHYASQVVIGKIHPEVEFSSPLEGTDFICAGKMDGIGEMVDGRTVLVESKTTGDSVSADSDFWMRLSFNLQVLSYIVEARKAGWDVSVAFYDVTRKPAIRPKMVNDVDEKGLKIVLDSEGNRAVKKNGEPRQTGGEGFTVQEHVETPDEFCDRLWRDTRERPEFYFCRKEIPVLESALEDFKRQRYVMVRMIEMFRAQEISESPGFKYYTAGTIEECNATRDPSAWPRHVDNNICNWCSYKSFCLAGVTPDLNRLPEGFEIVTKMNPELEKVEEYAPTQD